MNTTELPDNFACRLPQPPRNVILRKEAVVPLRLLRQWAYVGVGIFLLWLPLLIWCGVEASSEHQIQGWVVDAQTYSGRGLHHELTVEWKASGTPRRTPLDVKSVVYERYASPEGLRMARAPIIVSETHVGPFHRIFAQATELWLIWYLLLGFLPVLAGGAAWLSWIAWIKPKRYRRVCEQGDEVPGRVLKISPRKSGLTVDQSRYIREVRYEFNTRKGVAIRKKCLISEKEATGLAVGSGVRVLYDPAKPRRAMIYEFSVFRIR